MNDNKAETDDDAMVGDMARLCDKLWQYAQQMDLPDEDKQKFKRVLDSVMVRAMSNAWGGQGKPVK